MGLAITADEQAAPPRPLTVWLICDTPACAGMLRIENPLDGYAGARTAATRAGWVEHQVAQGRTLSCPTCAGVGDRAMERILHRA